MRRRLLPVALALAIASVMPPTFASPGEGAGKALVGSWEISVKGWELNPECVAVVAGPRPEPHDRVALERWAICRTEMCGRPEMRIAKDGIGKEGKLRERIFRERLASAVRFHSSGGRGDMRRTVTFFASDQRELFRLVGPFQ